MRRSVPMIIRFTGLVLAVIVFLSAPQKTPSLFGAEKESDETDYPLGLVNVPSLDRLREITGAMFESADRKDMSDVVDQWTITTLKETKGIDRTRPFGMMLYLKTQDFIRPIGITYIPVSNLQETLQTLAYDRGAIKPLTDNQNRYDIEYTERFTMRTLYRHGYLFMVGPDGGETDLDRNFPDPARVTAKMTSNYDLAISVMMKGIPVGMKTLFIQTVKNTTTATLQQRDDEPESVYRLRRANGEYWLEFFDKIASQGEEITIGGRLDSERKSAHVDVDIIGTANSKLAKFFENMAGKRTYFGNLLGSSTTFATSISLLLDEKQRKPFQLYLEAAQRDLASRIEAKNEDLSGLAEITNPLFKMLAASLDTGHLDLIAQVEGSQRQNFVLLAGIKLATSRNLPTQLTDLLKFLKDNAPDSDLMEDLELESDIIDGCPVHRFPLTPPGDLGEFLFGNDASLYLYASPQAVWISLGSDEAVNSLRSAVDAVTAPQAPQPGRNRIPFLLVTHARNWLSQIESKGEEGAAFKDRVDAAFENENDSLKVEIRPTDTGVRLRAEFESGFISLMGRNISATIDRGLRDAKQKADEAVPNQPAVEDPKN